jgi:hypothetical protein
MHKNREFAQLNLAAVAVDNNPKYTLDRRHLTSARPMKRICPGAG